MLAQPRHDLDDRYQGSAWPEVTACSFSGCVMRVRADVAPPDWTCPQHRDDAAVILARAGALAEHAHAELTAPPTEAPEPDRPRYRPAPSPRLSPDWRQEVA